jgi:hypothetical protein
LTAEIAILNKSAVALAADSAVTISAGSSQEKIYDTADKLFELSDHQPIGVMINNDMNFMEVPLPVLIKEYRRARHRFRRVEDAAADFLTYLHQCGRGAPQQIKLQHLRRTITPLVSRIHERSTENLVPRLMEEARKGGDKFDEITKSVIDEQIAVMRVALEQAPDASLIGGKKIRLSQEEKDVVADVISKTLQMASDEQRADLSTVLQNNLHKMGLSAATTGVVVAGFAEEMFPTLIAYRLEGLLGNRLKFAQEHLVDIDRRGDRARVLPFAQREMVERFLYGLDASIERQITQFCKRSVPKIREHIVERLEMSDEDRNKLVQDGEEAERAFFDGLAEESFDAIRKQSRAEIEDMVEFMPKPEMAKMAEALVNLTSIKRRVSRGMETVGGPIDVAVISKAEGFIWVKRKHYFTEELNYRFFDRMRRRDGPTGRDSDGQNLQPRDDGSRVN